MKLKCPVCGGRAYTLYVQLPGPRGSGRSFLAVASYFLCEKSECLLWVPSRDLVMGEPDAADLGKAVHLKVPEVPASIEAMIQRPKAGRRRR